MSDTLQQAITLIQSGDRQNGKSLLADVIKADPQNERAWLWMTIVMDSSKQRQECLQRVLMINPHNQSAIEGLALLQEEQSQRRKSLGFIAGPIAGLFSGTISTIVSYRLSVYCVVNYLWPWLLSVGIGCRCLGDLVIEIPVFLIVVALSLGIGCFIGLSVWFLCLPMTPSPKSRSRIEQKVVV